VAVERRDAREKGEHSTTERRYPPSPAVAAANANVFSLVVSRANGEISASKSQSSVPFSSIASMYLYINVCAGLYSPCCTVSSLSLSLPFRLLHAILYCNVVHAEHDDSAASDERRRVSLLFHTFDSFLSFSSSSSFLLFFIVIVGTRKRCGSIDGDHSPELDGNVADRFTH